MKGNKPIPGALALQAMARQMARDLMAGPVPHGHNPPIKITTQCRSPPPYGDGCNFQRWQSPPSHCHCWTLPPGAVEQASTSSTRPLFFDTRRK